MSRHMCWLKPRCEYKNKRLRARLPNRRKLTYPLICARAPVTYCPGGQRSGVLLLENPTSSLVWLDPACVSWRRLWIRRAANVAACLHGLDMDKCWPFVSNHPGIASFASLCPHLKGFRAALAGFACLMVLSRLACPPVTRLPSFCHCLNLRSIPDGCIKGHSISRLRVRSTSCPALLPTSLFPRRGWWWPA